MQRFSDPGIADRIRVFPIPRARSTRMIDFTSSIVGGGASLRACSLAVHPTSQAARAPAVVPADLSGFALHVQTVKICLQKNRTRLISTSAVAYVCAAS
jgi:hypothetical protein